MTSMAMKATIAAKTGGGGLKQPLLNGDGKDPESQEQGESDAASKPTGIRNPANILFYALAGGLSTLWGMGATSGVCFALYPTYMSTFLLRNSTQS